MKPIVLRARFLVAQHRITSRFVYGQTIDRLILVANVAATKSVNIPKSKESMRSAKISKVIGLGDLFESRFGLFFCLSHAFEYSGNQHSKVLSNQSLHRHNYFVDRGPVKKLSCCEFGSLRFQIHFPHSGPRGIGSLDFFPQGFGSQENESMNPAGCLSGCHLSAIFLTTDFCFLIKKLSFFTYFLSSQARRFRNSTGILRS